MTTFDLTQKAGRFLFSEDQEYAGKLIGVSKRLIENKDPNIWLLRLEFEIFLIDNESDRADIGCISD